jgi:peptidylprolyl isomerase
MIENEVKQGDLVCLKFSVTTQNGTPLRSAEAEPVDLCVGEGQLSLDIEEALIGMTPGQTKEIGLPLEETYGPYCQEGVIEVKKEQVIDPKVKCSVGETIVLQLPNKEKKLKATIKEIKGDHLLVDLNHPLAGQNAIVRMELLEIL